MNEQSERNKKIIRRKRLSLHSTPDTQAGDDDFALLTHDEDLEFGARHS
jgi:hypothetical protein